MGIDIRLCSRCDVPLVCVCVCVGLFCAVVGFWLGVPWVRCQFLYCSNKVCLYLDVFVGGFRWGNTQGAGKAMMMRGGACATELCLMAGCVRLSNSNWCWLSCGW